MSRLTEEQRLVRARVSLMRNKRWQYLSGILMLGEHRVIDRAPSRIEEGVFQGGPVTAYTDGRDVYYGREYIRELSDPELEGVILHEAFHVMYRHMTVWRHLFLEDPARANAACDYVINLQIVQAGATLPPGVLYDEEFKGLDTKQVYDLLEGEDQPSAGHDGHDWDGAQDIPEQERKAFAREIDRALREGAILASRSGENRPRELTDLLRPQVDWREVLREFVKTNVKGNEYATWRRPARRHIHSGVYIPGQISDAMGHAVVAVDTSGSVSDKELTIALSEVEGIAQDVTPDRMDLLYWGHEIAGHETYEGEDVLSFTRSTKPIGGGGTQVSVVFDLIEEEGWEPQCVIIVTDGYTPWPKQPPSYPVLFVMTSGITAPFGQTVRLMQ